MSYNNRKATIALYALSVGCGIAGPALCVYGAHENRAAPVVAGAAVLAAGVTGGMVAVRRNVRTFDDVVKELHNGLYDGTVSLTTEGNDCIDCKR